VGWAQCGKIRVSGRGFIVYTYFENLAVGCGLKNAYFMSNALSSLAPTVRGIIKHENNDVPLLGYANISKFVCG
jgi:hypothetical protein